MISKRPGSRGWIEPPSASKAFRKNERTKYGWSRRASAFSISSFTAKSRSALIVSWARALRLRSDFRWSWSRALVDLLGEAGAHLRLVAVADGLDQQVLEALPLEDLAEDVEDAALERLALDLELFEQPMIDVALAGLLGDEIPEVADLGLADAVDAPEALFEPVGIPRQVVVDHQVGVLEVHAFAGGVGGDEHADLGIGAEERLKPAALVAVRAAVDGDDGVAVAEHAGDLLRAGSSACRGARRR